MKKILVTGGSGFIGTNLIECYSESNEFEVLNIDIKPPKIVEHKKFWKEANILDRDTIEDIIKKFNPDYIIHLAARANLTGKSLKDYEVNTEGVKNIIMMGNKYKTIRKIIFASTMLVCKAGYIPKKDDDYCPPNFYGESKMIGENIVRSESKNFEWTIVRPTSIWGPWFGPTYKKFFEMIIEGKYINFSSKMSTKTYGYVGNLVYQLDKILFSESSNGRTLYLGDYSPTNIKEWANEIADELDKKIYEVPTFLIRTVAIFGDIAQKLKIKFPINSFRFENMITDNIVPLDATKRIAPETKFSRIQGIKLTLDWMESKRE